MQEIFVYACIAVGVLFLPASILIMIFLKIGERSSAKNLPPRPVHRPRKRVQ